MSAPTSSVSLAIVGSGGSGVVVISQLLQRALARAGWCSLLQRSAGPQIRGGESLAMLRIHSEPVACPDDRFDLLVALDWHNYARFADEVPPAADCRVLADTSAGEAPAGIASAVPTITAVPFAEAAKNVPGGRANMVCLGFLGVRLGLTVDAMQAVAADRLGGRGDAVLEAVSGCIALGADLDVDCDVRLPAATASGRAHWLLSGNEATGHGLMAGGVRFAAAYPITPASDLLEWMAPRLVSEGGQLVQAEDELASINMAIGASFAGVPSATATSGPGLALMSEGLGLAVASETPVTVVDVMRGGPSTGIPTKSEQGDLNLALYGLHGDAPHVVTAALSVRDCATTAALTADAAERLQTAAIMLSDQSLAQSIAVVDPVELPTPVGRLRTTETDGDYLRYLDTDSGISPMSVPGEAGGAYTADGLEHDQHGTPSAAAADHARGLHKRAHKLTELLRRAPWDHAWGEVRGAGELVLITFGSAAGAVFEAADRLSATGQPTRAVALRLLSPLPVTAIEAAVAGASRIVVVECNHEGQLFHYLKARTDLGQRLESLTHPGPLPLRPGALVDLARRHN